METGDLLLSPATQDDRIMAAIAHATILVPFMGIIGPIVIWATQKDKSRYVAFQALQATVFQISLVAVSFLAFGCYIISFFGMFLLAAAVQSNGSLGNGEIAFLFPFLSMFIMLGANVVFIITGIVAAVLTLQGRNFRYPVIGPYLARTVKF